MFSNKRSQARHSFPGEAGYLLLFQTAEIPHEINDCLILWNKPDSAGGKHLT